MFPWVPRAALALFGVALGLWLGYEAIRGVNWTDVATAMRGFPPGLILASALLILAAHYVSGIRWRLLLPGQGVSANRLFLIETASIGFNNVSPVRVLAEPTQVAILTARDKMNPGTVLASRGVARLLDGTATIIMVWGGIFLVPGLAAFWILAAIATAVAGTGVLVIFLVGLAPRRFARLRDLSPVEGFAQGLESIRRRPGRVALAFGLSGTYLFMLGLSGLLISTGIGHPLGVLPSVIAVLGPLFFGTSVPGLPAALGTYEFASRSLLEGTGMATETAITFAILAHFLLFFVPMVLTVIVLPREGVGTLRNATGIVKDAFSK